MICHRPGGKEIKKAELSNFLKLTKLKLNMRKEKMKFKFKFKKKKTIHYNHL